METFKKNIINKLIFVFDNAHIDIMNQLNALSETYQKNKELADSKENKSDISTDDSDELICEIDKHNYNQTVNIFKKIKMIFNILSDLLKYKIAQITDERYQKIYDEKIKFPETLDKLIVVIGCYSDAFTQDDMEILYNVINYTAFSDLYNIANINSHMIPFVINDSINVLQLQNDFNGFANMVKNFACDVLNVNTNFQEDSFIEYDEIVDDELIMEEMI